LFGLIVVAYAVNFSRSMTTISPVKVKSRPTRAGLHRLGRALR
jgi:hypothetical protein